MKAAILLAISLSVAPLQCAGDPDPRRGYDTPEETLYGLAERFRKQGDVEAWHETLDYLIERYPNSRFAARAKDDLAKAGK
jgi:outer membrane protein assembly factor BamD (BamD/ComL family)